MQGEHYHVTPAARETYAALPTSSRYACANAAIIDLGDRTVVVDSGLTAAAGRELAAAALALTGRPAELLLNTHYHSDHVWGNAAFAAQNGARLEFAASAGTRQLMLVSGQQEIEWYRATAPAEIRRLDAELARHTPSRVRDALEAERSFYAAARAELDTVRLCPPTLTFDRRLCLFGRDSTLEAITYGGGHSRSDAVVWIAESGVLIAGDLVTVETHPYLGDGDAVEWLHILRTLQTHQPQVLIPGHGPVRSGTDAQAALETLIEYIEHVLELADGAPLDEDGREDDETDRWLVSLEPPEQYAGWDMGSFYARNVRHEVRGLSRGRRNS